MLALEIDISCIILAGGKNSRMGRQKAFLKLGERAILEEQIYILNELFKEIIVVTNTLETFRDFDAKVVKDIIPGIGPMGGLYSGLSVSSNVHNFLIGCDMPFINLQLLRYMLGQIEENDIVIPLSRNGLETLFAIYSIVCLETLVDHVESQNLRLADILGSHKVRYITQEEVRNLDPEELSFFNINTPGDLELAKKIWAKR